MTQAPTAIDHPRWSARLADLAAHHGVPGAQLGILQLDVDGNESQDISTYGVLNAVTGRDVLPQSVFQIGSITKVWTATLAMMLVDEGLLSLESRVIDIIPGFQVADVRASKTITVKDLLTHTNGLDGDIFTDTGRGDDALKLYVESLSTAGQIHPVGATWSYSNTGYVILGRIIEVLTGQTWDQAISERLFTPLGLQSTTTLPEQTILHDPAIGHLTGMPNATVSPVWSMARAVGPAGLITASASDVLSFAALHLREGLTHEGTRLLSTESCRSMASHQVELPEKHSLGDSWGLGWIRFDWNGRRLLGHDGSTYGQQAFLRILQDQRVAVVLLTNGGQGHDLFTDLFTEIFKEAFKVDVPRPFSIPSLPPAFDGFGPWSGSYENTVLRLDLDESDSDPGVTVSYLGELAAMTPNPVRHYALIPVAENLYAMNFEGAEQYTPLMFFTLEDGSRYIHFGGRATKKVA